MSNLDIRVFEKRHDFLICIDSDGTVIDAMSAKHNHCHGPALIHVWHLEEYAKEVQSLWNTINLYSSTRGVNRFIALVIFLEKANGVYLRVDGLEKLKQWVETSGNLSNEGLEEELKHHPDPMLQKALQWSYEINDRILMLSHTDKPPYLGVKEFFDFAHGKVDIALISSSNMSALVEEWSNHNLIQYLDVLTSQEIGTKEECVHQLIEKGYNPRHVLMIGDANPDLKAATDNDTYFYPILTQHEKESWDNLKDSYFKLFTSENYAEHQNSIIQKFKDNLSVNS